jgi:hypothetical protein
MSRPRILTICVLAACTLASLQAATLERLSTADLVQKSTDVVRAKVVGYDTRFRGTAGRGGILYTHYTVQVLERWKGDPAARMDVAVPGGTLQNVRQTFPGAPTLEQGVEYVFFLWTSRSGLTQIMGLSQGLLSEKVDAGGATVLCRNASSEPMVDSSGQAVSDTSLTMPLSAFRTTMQSYGLVGK